MTLFLGELTNPFNLLRKILELNGKKERSLTFGYTFCVLFIIIRVLLLPYIVKEVQYSPELWDPIWFKVLTGGMFFLSLMWAFMILNLCSKQLAEVVHNKFHESNLDRQIPNTKASTFS